MPTCNTLQATGRVSGPPPTRTPTASCTRAAAPPKSHGAHAGIDITVDAVTSELENQHFDVPSYSWVHLNDFRLFELHGRYYP